MSWFQGQLRAEGLAETSICTDLVHVRAALNWAKAMEMVRDVPRFALPKPTKGQRLMRGRPITGEEFDRMLAAVEVVRPNDSERWRFFLQGLWLSGLRLGESLELSWDEEGRLLVDFSGPYPRFRIWAEAEKGKRDRLLPITPDFAEFLSAVPVTERFGYVFWLPGAGARSQMTRKRVTKVVSRIGKQAGVLVNHTQRKTASAHDLRRSFGSRWASKVKPAILRLLMRHESIETSLKYYVEHDSEEVSRELWAEWEGKQGTAEIRRGEWQRALD